MPASNSVSSIPTHIITGFLGVGKTSTITHLLANKPNDERWAILVNEFGEIGIDGNLYDGQQAPKDSILVKEVPGGCMCCTAGLPMQVALNQLIVKAKPDRLFIEPTGLGHPKEVLDTLSTEHYRDVIDLQKVVTLVDARKFKDSRYTEHETFNDQIEIADLIVANKEDLYAPEDKVNLESYIGKTNPEARILSASYGAIALEQLSGVSQYQLKSHAHHSHEDHHHSHGHQSSAQDINEMEIPECGFLRSENKGEGYFSTGWRIKPTIVFNHSKLFNWISGLDVERLKGVFITDEGIFAYNFSGDALTEFEMDDCLESRFEIIASKTDPEWEAALRSCIQ